MLSHDDQTYGVGSEAFWVIRESKAPDELDRAIVERIAVAIQDEFVDDADDADENGDQETSANDDDREGRP